MKFRRDRPRLPSAEFGIAEEGFFFMVMATAGRSDKERGMSGRVVEARESGLVGGGDGAFASANP